MSSRTDPLAGLNSGQRRRKEGDDARYIAQKMEGRIFGSAEAIAVAGNTFAGTREFSPDMLKPYEKDDPEMTVAVCARINLDHPLYFADNLFAECADCGCDLQYRPDQLPPKAEKLCVCCCAQRLREEPA